VHPGEDPSTQVRDRGVQAVLRELDAEELPLPAAHLQELRRAAGGAANISADLDHEPL
jgi:hypothetical protein